MSFLKHPQLVRVVQALGEHRSAADAYAAVGITAQERPAITRALGTLADTGMIVERLVP